MYQKKVSIGKYSYTYYYHNAKIKGKVRNICLAADAAQAKEKLRKIREQAKRKGKPIGQILEKLLASQRKKRKINKSLAITG